jgi:hypothetical protein
VSLTRLAAAQKLSDAEFKKLSTSAATAADHYAEHSREAAEALRELAAVHEGMAEIATAKSR